MFVPAWLAAACMVVAPLFAGAAVGLVARGLLGRRIESLWALGALTAVLSGLGASTALLLAQVGLWDVVFVALLFAAATAASLGLPAGKAGRRALGRVSAKAAVTLILLEIGARLLFPGSRVFEGNSTTALTPYEFWSAFDPYRWTLLFPDQHPQDLAAALAQPARPPHRGPHPRVLHVGDSMLVIGDAGSPLAGTFPSRIAQLQPGVDHINAGVAATGIDFHFQLIRTLQPRVRPDLVVLYVFGADLWLMDRAYLFCGLQPLFDGAKAHPQPRCTRPSAPEGLVARLRPPPPLPFRVAVDFSRFAQVAFLAYMKSVPEYPFADRGDAQSILADKAPAFAQWLGAIADFVAASGARLVVVALPDRAALDGNADRRDLYRQIVQRASAVLAPRGVPVLQAHSLFADVVARDGSDAWFLDSCHFRGKGHARLASWLDGQLGPLLAARR